MADFWNTSIRKFGTLSGDYGMDGSTTYAENKKARIHFAHADAARVVSFKAFIDGFKIDGDYGVGEEQMQSSNFVVVTQGISSFSYSLNLNVPAHSFNEAKANLAKFQELSRYIVSHRTGNPEDMTSYVYVLLANLIQNGLYDDAEDTYVDPDGNMETTLETDGGRAITNWGWVRKYGAKTFISTLDFTPDNELGYFEMGGKLIPKAYKISLKMKIQPLFEDVTILPKDKGVEIKQTRVCFDGFVNDPDEIYTFEDTRHWPFGITMSNYMTNRINHEKFGKDGSGDYAENKGALIRIGDKDVNAFVVFKAFLEDFKFKRQVESEKFEDIESTVQYAEMGGGLKPDNFSLSIKVPAHSVNEARANLKKIQTLFRMAIKKHPGMDEEMNIFGRTSGGEVYVHFSNLIKRSTGSSTIQNVGGEKEWTSIKENGLVCILGSLAISIEDDAGMFEMGGYFYPKVLSLSFDLKVNDDREINAGRSSLTPQHTDGLPAYDEPGWLFGIEYCPDSIFTPKVKPPPVDPPETPPEGEGTPPEGEGGGEDDGEEEGADEIAE